MNQTKKRKEHWIENDKDMKGRKETELKEKRRLSNVHLWQQRAPLVTTGQKQEWHIILMKGETVTAWGLKS